ncbi:MAG: thiamine pyrophosphate-dependent enzyme [Minisyncoccia bacterium]|jgi:2-oxoglutarate ferredoxin oxidoreductase subunit beta
MPNLSTQAKITWCPGCPNNAILVAFREAITELVSAGLKLENIVTLSGIGCHGKITDYLNMNTFTSLHGRLVPTMTGIKTANPSLAVVGFSGDGDSYSEGLDHLIQAARRNSDVHLFIHDNEVFALTTGQATSTSPKGFKGKSTPSGSIEEPFNPLLLMLSAGTTFVARSYAPDIARTKEIMKAAIAHKGFSFVDIIQPCLTFNDTRDYFAKRMYWLDEKFPTDDIVVATEKAREYDGKIPFGIFYRVEKPTFEEQI